MKKFTILSLSLFTLLAGAALSPALPSISQAFPQVNKLWIQALVTIPSICVIFWQVLATKVSTKFSSKKQLIIGLILYSFGGGLPVLTANFTLIIVSRIVLGVGLGIIADLSVELINSNYQDAERKRMLSYAGALNNGGTVLAVLYAGLTAKLNWHLVFYLYLLALIPLCLVFSFLKDESMTSKRKLASDKTSFEPEFLFIAGEMLITTIIYFIVPTNLGYAIKEYFKINNSLITGGLMALISILGVIAGLLFSRNRLKNKSVLIGLFTMFSCSMLFLSLENSLMLFVIGAALSGFSLGIALPLFNQEIISISNINSSNRNLSIGQAMIFLGQFISPFLITELHNLLNCNVFQIGCGLSLILLFLNIIKPVRY
ncbi:MFS transporter [Lactobacillus sp. ESL0679]|uniref:MFS transporter n=1 Tax=Lactobacillus sp. ESL0679 TaxID=2983209 RepID=UPI0023F8C3A1|nr:MFS transporter [Lactobacillus sp. ESL0679]MDF7683542.1 MFS transporter [Lactobacillus sp. ESL0679]